jgi:hypothetical protein
MPKAFLKKQVTIVTISDVNVLVFHLRVKDNTQIQKFKTLNTGTTFINECSTVLLFEVQ